MDPRLRRILDAWNKPGPAPQFHLLVKSWVRRNWPTLARALDETTFELKDQL